MRGLLGRLASGVRLSSDEAERAFGAVLDGHASDAEIAAMLMALRVRGETPDELVGLVRGMRARMIPIAAPPDAIDLCGTGGDGQATLNVSTAAAIVVAACGTPVAKHGNRAVSSMSGAADVLACLGIDPDPDPAAQVRSLEVHGIAFLFAPRHHASLRHAAAARRMLPTRTIFNLAGPLANPAGVRRQLVGVSEAAWAEPIVRALATLGCERALVVHGGTGAGPGLDELALAGPSIALWLRAGRIEREEITPEQAGLARAPIEAIRGGMPADNARAITALLTGELSAYRDTVLLNAAAALMVADRAADLHEGASLAADAIDTGRARMLLQRLASTHQMEPLRPCR